MATREEKLKKITDELEQLSDEELENVAGGTYLESSEDAIRFQKNGVDLGISTIGKFVAVMGHNDFVKLRGAFEKFGVTIKDKGGLVNANEYFLNGKLVSREDAWKHIESQLKK